MARLSTLKPRLSSLGTHIASAPPKQADNYYHSTEWAALRRACLERDSYACQLCGGPAKIADHIVSRRNGGADELPNLRAVCRACDNRLKEDHLGRRRGMG